MGKLHELIAVETDLKSEAVRLCTEVAELFTKATGKFVGQIRRYQPLAEDGEHLPDEVTELATTVNDQLQSLWVAYGRWIDATVQKEVTNMGTSAFVVVSGEVILKDLPATALLNLESKLATLRGVYVSIPTNDTTERWEWDSQQGVYVSVPKESRRTKKVPKSLVGYEATKEHPAQIQYYTEDVPEGTWTTFKRSGMLSPSQKRVILERLDELIRAVKTARQRANDTEASKVQVAQVIQDFLHRE